MVRNKLAVLTGVALIAVSVVPAFADRLVAPRERMSMPAASLAPSAAPVPQHAEPRLDREVLSSAQDEAADVLIRRAIAQLVRVTPELAGLSVKRTMPSFSPDAKTPDGVYAELLLPERRNVAKMQLVRTRSVAGKPVPESVDVSITNLRGLILAISLATGQVQQVGPLPTLEEAADPASATRVAFLNPDPNPGSSSGVDDE